MPIYAQNTGQHNYVNGEDFDYKLHKQKIDSLKKFNYLSYKYHFLDSNYQIRIDEKTFNKAIHKYNFLEDRIKSYKDSLGVVLMIEFNDWNKVRIGKQRISYSWLRLGYHTWQSEQEAENFAHLFGITHPWRMREYLVDETNNNPLIVDFINNLRTKIKEESQEQEIDHLSRKKLLNKALLHNPRRIKDYAKLIEVRKKQEEAYLKEHGELHKSNIGVGCGKKNCCQKQNPNHIK